MQAERLFQEAQQFHQRGQLIEAMKRYDRVISLDKNHAPALIFRALLLQQSGKPHEALTEAERALAAMKKPELPVLVNYGIILKNAGQYDEAARAYEQALELNPNLLSAKSNLATIYLMQGRLDEAETRFHELSERMEESAPFLNLARIALVRERTEEACHYLDRAEDLDPSHPDVHMLRARIASMDKDFESAYRHCMTSLKRNPPHRDTWLILQSLDAEVFDLDEVADRLDDLAKLEVQSATVLSIAVDFCRKHWLWRSLKKLETMLAQALMKPLDKMPSSSDVFTLLGADVPQKAHLASAKACWQVLCRGADRSKRAVAEVKEAEKKFRVGILSSDLRGHAIGYLIVGLFEHLPKHRIEWWAYNNAFADSSSVRERFRENFDRFINVAKLTDPELADKIRADKIDVLIDLNQMTAMTRATVMAYRPAPVQIQWLGMPGTLGAGEDVDYVIVDPWVAHAGNADGFSECLLMLPRSYQPNDHVAPDLSLCASRVEAGLPETGVVFGVFNQYYKFSPDTFALWALILRKVPDAVLWLLEPRTEQLKERIRSQALTQGIEPERIVFAASKPQKEHLARLQWMDLVLDTWPYNAHTTCSDALRAGVPVLTFPHETFASRVAAGILDSAGLSEWIALTGDEYVQKAVDFGLQSRETIDSIKADTQARYWSSRMVDNAALGHQLEALVLGTYARAAEGLEPTSLKLNDDLSLEALPFGRQADVNTVKSGQTNTVPPVTTETRSNAETIDDNTLTAVNDRITDISSQQDWVCQISTGSKKARLNNLAILQQSVIGMTETPLVVDVGAAIEGEIGYESLADAGLARILGFEPDPACFAKLENSQYRQFLALALGDGQGHTLSVCRASGMNSLLTPRTEWLSLFPGFAKWGEVTGRLDVETRRLDDILEARNARFAKLDVQGAELMILQNGVDILKNLSMLQIESSPSPLYHDEPSFFEVGSWLRTQGFVLHTLSNENKRCLKPFGTEENPYAGKNQIFQVDAVFIPDPLSWENLSIERLHALAFFAHALYRSYDVTMSALSVIDRREGGENRVEAYRVYLDKARLDA